MIGFEKRMKRDMAVLVLRDAQGITELLREALDAAPAAERPGLERAKGWGNREGRLCTPSGSPG
ncbi:hypothetical protein ACWD63_30140, partial [Streptomyces clavifer]